MKRLLWLLCVGISVAFTMSHTEFTGNAAQSAAPKQKKKAASKKAKPKPADPAPKPPLAPERSFDSVRSIGRAEETAVKKIATVIKDSLEIGPTLVVWILDRTPSAAEMVHDVGAAAQS